MSIHHVRTARVARDIACASMLVVGACGSPPPTTSHTPAASVEHAQPEGDLPVVVLTAEAVARLGIETSTVEASELPRTRLVGGEVVIPPGRTIALTAPVAGIVRRATAEPLSPGATVVRGAPLLRLVPLAPADRDVSARATREVSAAEATLAAAELRVRRNEQLIAENAGAARLLEEAIAARDVARADVTVARARASTVRREPLMSDVTMTVRAPEDGIVRAVTVAEGQAVPAAAPLAEIVSGAALYVRVPIYGGDLAQLDTTREASVSGAHDGEGVMASLVAGPPTAEPDRMTVDRFYALPPGSNLAPGERVLVSVPLRDVEHATHVPLSAIVHDAWGGAWVYRCESETRFVRARVDPVRRVGARAVLAHGPAAGTCVVSVGAADVFGSEFPPGH